MYLIVHGAWTVMNGDVNESEMIDVRETTLTKYV